jgi:hypothetical protein
VPAARASAEGHAFPQRHGGIKFFCHVAPFCPVFFCREQNSTAIVA